VADKKATKNPPWREQQYQTAYWLLVLPLIATLCLFYAFPLSRIAWISVSDPTLGIDNYVKVVESTFIHKILSTTLRLCILTTLFSVVVGYFVAFMLVHVGHVQRTLFLFCIIVPFWVSALLRGFAWLALLHDQGIVNTAFIAMGLVDRPIRFLGHDLGVLLGMVHFMVPFAIFTIYSHLRTIDRNLSRAAASLGANPFISFWRIYFPLSLPGILAGTVLVFILCLGFYITPAILGRGNTLMAAEYIETRILQLGQWGPGATMGILLFVSIMIALYFLGRRFDLQKIFGAK
jgi:putative spermidine/putrescine transport system permease protein